MAAPDDPPSTTPPATPAGSPYGRPPGMVDVAKLAGVSHQTVSRVLNHHPNVKEQTRSRVNEAIARLGYRPNTAARALVTRRSRIIGVIATSSPLFGPSSTLLSVESAARDAGYFVSVASLKEPSPEYVSLIFDHFMSQSVEGVVVIAPHDLAAAAAAGASLSVPVVLVAADAPVTPGMPSVYVDQAGGAAQAVQHLISLGHRSIAHLSGPTDWFDARARIRGWREALAAAGIPAGRLYDGDWSSSCGYEVGRQLIADGLPDAIFVSNDAMTLGVLRAFREEGIAVPEQISVVGFDDVPGSAYYDPPITTVRQDFEALGVLAVATLARLIRGENLDTAERVIPPTLIPRDSSGPRDQHRKPPAHSASRGRQVEHLTG